MYCSGQTELRFLIDIPPNAFGVSCRMFVDGGYPMRVSWMRDGDTRYGVMSGGDYRMIVELLPDRIGWDWVVWQKGLGPELVACGVASTADEAIRRVEDALSRLDREMGLIMAIEYC